MWYAADPASLVSGSVEAARCADPLLVACLILLTADAESVAQSHAPLRPEIRVRSRCVIMDGDNNDLVTAILRASVNGRAGRWAETSVGLESDLIGVFPAGEVGSTLPMDSSTQLVDEVI